MQTLNQNTRPSQPPREKRFYTAQAQLEESRRRALAYADFLTFGGKRPPAATAHIPSPAERKLEHQRRQDIERLEANTGPRPTSWDRPRIEWTDERWAKYMAHVAESTERLNELSEALASGCDRTTALAPFLEARAPTAKMPRATIATNGALAVARKPERTPRDLARYRAIRSGNIGRRMHKAALAVGSVIAWRAAQLLMDCGSNRNLWTATDLHKEDGGETYNGTGGLTRCNRKFCATCAADERRRARTRIRTALKPIRPERGERWRFITLTSPTLPALDVLEVIKIFNRAWRILCNGPMWRPLVAAGAKGIEFTISEHGFHVHIHALVLSKWIAQEKLKDEWTAAVKAAWSEFAIEEPINTKDGKMIVDIRLVRPKRTQFESQIGVDDAVNEVCKYLTKSQSWDSIPNDKLVALAEVLRWPRMVEVLGAARNIAGAAGEPSLDTPRLSAEAIDADGVLDNGETAADSHKKKQQNKAPPLITLDLDMPAGQWLETLIARRARQRSFRKTQLADRYQFAEFQLLNGDRWTFATVTEQRRRSEAWRAARKERSYDVSFTDGRHCPKCAGRLENFRCSACNIVIETRY